MPNKTLITIIPDTLLHPVGDKPVSFFSNAELVKALENLFHPYL